MNMLLLIWLTLVCQLLVAQDTPNFFQFVSRPDILAPKWDIEIYDNSTLTAGSWFVAPYESLIQHNYPHWNTAHIYNQDGELVWSAGERFGYYNIFDFRMSIINGEPKLTLIWPKNSDKQEGGIILNQAYELEQILDMRGDSQKRPNMHDLNIIEDGKRALMITTPYQDESHITIPGEYDGPCKVDFQGFKELDMKTNEILFEWNSKGHLNVGETTYYPGNNLHKNIIEQMCDSYWDITHFNSIDKFDDGDYLLSGRHMDTLYKISHVDGSIIWRLGGKKSDFVFPDPRTRFSRQHGSRFRGQNATHTLVSLFDNSVGDYPAKASSFESWGLLLALRTDTTPMEVSLVARFQKPYTVAGATNPREKARGNVQLLENGNWFVGWIEGSQIAEYAPDGRMLMEAIFKRTEAASYRCWKMPWVGRPSRAPDVLAEIFEVRPGQLRTIVHVSWNGDTEAATWNLLRTNGVGNVSELVVSSERQGFETKLEVSGSMKHVLAVALDSNGAEIGRSNVTAVDIPLRLQSAEINHEDADWVNTHSESWQSELMSDQAEFSKSNWMMQGVVFFGTAALVMTIYQMRRRKRSALRQQAYKSVAREEEEELEKYDTFLGK